jgi:hypothetical protein
MIEIEEKIRIIDNKLHPAEPNVEGPYNNQDRLVGEGSRRIGSEVMLNTDLFCLSAIICLKDTEILKYMDILSGNLVDCRLKENFEKDI